MPSLQESRQRAKDERLQAHRTDANTYRVYNTSKGTSYDVLQASNGEWRCTCPFATKASHVRPGICKHLARVLDRESHCTTCDTKATLVDGKCQHCRFLARLGF